MVRLKIGRPIATQTSFSFLWLLPSSPAKKRCNLVTSESQNNFQERLERMKCGPFLILCCAFSALLLHSDQLNLHFWKPVFFCFVGILGWRREDSKKHVLSSIKPTHCVVTLICWLVSFQQLRRWTPTHQRFICTFTPNPRNTRWGKCQNSKICVIQKAIDAETSSGTMHWDDSHITVALFLHCNRKKPYCFWITAVSFISAGKRKASEDREGQRNVSGAPEQNSHLGAPNR